MKRYASKRFGAMTAVAAVALLLLSWRPDTAGNTQANAAEPPGGLPKASRLTPRTWTRTLHNDGFLVGYSELRRNPLWVVYQAAPVNQRRPYKRPERFETDERTIARVSSRDYSRSGYQRGHLAPSWLIAQMHGPQAQRQTFLMSNITPQKPGLNQKLWQRLEMIESDYFARWHDAVWVITGPVFDGNIEQLRSGVEVPDAFYRIFVDEPEPGDIRILAFIVPQSVRGDEDLEQFLVTVDDIEEQTGLDFMSGMEDAAEQRIEAGRGDIQYWRLREVSQLPSRY